MDKEVYLDNSATTRPFDEIVKGVGNIIGEFYGNPSSLHNKGVESEKILKNSRQIVANSLGVSSGEIFFTSGGTESNNVALLGSVKALSKRIGTIITSSIEHASILKVFKSFEKQGYKVIYLPVNKEGIIDIDLLNKHLQSEHVALVSIMQVNNEVGTMQPIEEIIKLKKSYGFVLHVDAVQSYCKIKIDTLSKDIDMISISAHKIHGLKGTGSLYIKKGSKLEPLYQGGGQESHIKPGTENVPGIWSIGKAVEINTANQYRSIDKVRELRELLVNRILEEVPDVELNGTVEKDKSAPHIANISFKGVPGEVMLHALEGKGVYVSTGSACSTKKSELSHVLTSMGVNREVIKSSVRFSLALTNTREDIDYCVEAVKENMKILTRTRR